MYFIFNLYDIIEVQRGDLMKNSFFDVRACETNPKWENMIKRKVMFHVEHKC